MLTNVVRRLPCPPVTLSLGRSVQWFRYFPRVFACSNGGSVRDNKRHMTDLQMIHLIIRRFEQDTGVRMLIEWAKNKRQNFASDETTPAAIQLFHNNQKIKLKIAIWLMKKDRIEPASHSSTRSDRPLAATDCVRHSLTPLPGRSALQSGACGQIRVQVQSARATTQGHAEHTTANEGETVTRAMSPQLIGAHATVN
jgi:hypothetical protein